MDVSVVGACRAPRRLDAARASRSGCASPYGLAADGLVLKNGVPRNPLHTALVLELGQLRLPGGDGVLQLALGLLARVARRRGIDRELERRYL